MFGRGFDSRRLHKKTCIILIWVFLFKTYPDMPGRSSTPADSTKPRIEKCGAFFIGVYPDALDLACLSIPLKISNFGFTV
jgi:hypothetical protein